MKVLYLHDAEINSQMANLIQVKAMCKAMTDYGMEVTLSLPTNNKASATLAKEKSSFPFALHLRKSLIQNHKIDKYVNVCSVRNAIKDVNPNLIYLRSPLLLKQTIASKTSIIIELHKNRLHQGYAWLDKYWKHYLCKKAHTSQIKKVVCISDALGHFWENQGIPKNKIVTAHDGIDAGQFANPTDKAKTRGNLDLPKDKKIVTYVGRLYKNRKIDTVLDLAFKYPKALFLVVGGPDEEARLLREASRQRFLDNIIFTGHSPHEKITPFLYASDVLLALWSSEVKTINYCSPLKLFEYMGAGRIIVAHGFPTILEILQHKNNALICQPGSINDLVDKVGIALSMDYPNEMAAKAREDAFEKYTWTKRADSIFSGLFGVV